MAAEYEEVVLDGRTLKVSSPGKVYFPARGLTKWDAVSYYLAVSEGILRALRDRPTMLQRFPSGIEGETFFQKRVPAKRADWLATATIRFPSGRSADELAPADLSHVVWAANLGTITFHPWPVRTADVDRPDELRIDLDPQPGTGFADAVTVAAEARELLSDMGLVGFPKTSGGRGVHIYVRIRPEWQFTEVRRALIAFGRELARRMPTRVTTAWWKEERGERVFVDYNQAARDRTIACAYSLRPTARATVSTPVTWDELPDVDPDDFTLTTVPDRLRTVGDPHAGLDERAYGLEALLELADRQEHDGLGDLPYPPDYPKMPGEPPRVQPSRARHDS
ncbi:MAG TPA: non-homologous end-joining DNA ligase [Actinocatenispora sp.]